MIHSDQVWTGVFSVIAAVIAALAVVWSARRASRSADRADRRDAAIHQDQLKLNEFQEIANQNRRDRQEMRDERRNLVDRVAVLENQLIALRQQVADLEYERSQDRQHIAALETQLTESEKIRQSLTRYVRKLQNFIQSLGKQPPGPDDVLKAE